jgi:murein DD-endopeptidase MepM/ murein hydrolase activator NlpD
MMMKLHRVLSGTGAQRIRNTTMLLVACLTLLLVPLFQIVRAQETTESAGLTIHVVQRGETLHGIAQLYGTTVDELVRLNGLLDPSSLEVGQRLLVPTTLAGVAAAPVATATPPPQNVFHVVLPGETLFRIATQYGVSVNEVAQANGITDPSVIYPGQQLLIPGVQPPQLATNLPASVTSVTLQPQILMNGRTGMIRIVTAIPATVSATIMDLTVSDGTDQARLVHTLLFGVPIQQQPGMYPAVITIDDGTGVVSTLTLNVQLVPGTYGVEAINIPDDRLSLLSAHVDAAEAERVRALMSVFNSVRYLNGPMGLPAAAAVTSPFGSTRSYNSGALQRLHIGTDFGGAPGAPVFAPANGIIVFSGGLDVRGNTIIIDHGWGVFTGYWHLTDRLVNVGDAVTTQQVIGTVGSTGRSTGPHLHWELWVNGVPVDPMQWVQMSFSP